MESTYFKRTILEGSVKSTHICSFDKDIKLTKLVQRGTKVIDSVITSSSKVDAEESAKSKEASVREELRHRIGSIRINGQPIILEELGEAFDDDEIIEVIAFINGADMSKFGGAKKSEAQIKEDELKNV